MAIDTPPVCTRFSRSLPRRPESALTARRLVSSSLAAWGLEAVEDSAHLVVTELVSNAAKHADKAMVLVSVTRRAEHVVRVAVVDRSEAMPVIRAATPDAVTGRGLALVAAMCGGQWGVDRMRWGASTGKCVWADLETTST